MPLIRAAWPGTLPMQFASGLKRFLLIKILDPTRQQPPVQTPLLKPAIVLRKVIAATGIIPESAAAT